MNIGDKLKVLSDPVRREILQLLKKDRRTERQQAALQKQ